MAPYCMNDVVQRALDKANGLHLKPQRAPFEEARAHLIGHSTADQTVSVETQQRRGRSATATMTRSKIMYCDQACTKNVFTVCQNIDYVKHEM